MSTIEQQQGAWTLMLLALVGLWAIRQCRRSRERLKLRRDLHARCRQLPEDRLKWTQRDWTEHGRRLAESYKPWASGSYKEK